MAKVTVIGIGNPIRGDDRLGWEIIDRLNERFYSTDVDCAAVQQLTMDLVETLSETETVIFIDARIGEKAGEIQRSEIRANSSLLAPTTHFFDPQTLLAAVQALFNHHPKAILFTMTTNEYDFTEGLSEPIKKAFPILMRTVEEEIALSLSDSRDP